MRIVYHHRTRSTDAQRIHIQEIVRAFEELLHRVDVVSLVPLDAEQHDAQRDAGDAWWKKLVRRIPYAYEAAQLGYNLVGIPMVFWRALRSRADFIYERYALFNFAGVVAARLLRIPLALEVNSPFALEQSRDREIRALRFAAWTERLICRLATRVIVVSTPLAKIMHASGVALEKIDVMSNGVALSRFRPGVKNPALAEELGLGDCVVIGFVGWFRKWHGLEMLLEAFRLSELAEQRVKIALDKRTHLERFKVIRVVVPGTQYVVAEHYAAFYFRAKAFIARFNIHINEAVVFLRTVAVFYAVEPRKVRCSFRRRNYIIRG
jgi:glycosyltransferase involved in cell wall biosynthesis